MIGHGDGIGRISRPACTASNRIIDFAVVGKGQTTAKTTRTTAPADRLGKYANAATAIGGDLIEIVDRNLAGTATGTACTATHRGFCVPLQGETTCQRETAVAAATTNRLGENTNRQCAIGRDRAAQIIADLDIKSFAACPTRSTNRLRLGFAF